MATLASGVAQRSHDVTLAQPRVGDEHDVAALLDEVQVKQVLDEQPVDLGGPVPIELIKRLEHGKSGQLDAPLYAAIIPRSGLAVYEFCEVLQVRPVLVGGTLRIRLMVLEHERQVQRAHVRVQCIGIGVGRFTGCWHQSSPWRS